MSQPHPFGPAGQETPNNPERFSNGEGFGSTSPGESAPGFAEPGQPGGQAPYEQQHYQGSPGTYGQQPPPYQENTVPQPPYGGQDQYGQEPYGQGGWQPTPPPPPPGSRLADESTGFFAALFDFNFQHFVTPKIIKVVYIVITVLIALGAIGFLIAALASGEGGAIFAALIFVPLGALIYLALARMSLELYYAVIRLSEDVNDRLPRQ